MKFKRELFERANLKAYKLEVALWCIAELVEILNDYITDDELAALNGYGVFGNKALPQVKSILSTTTVGNFIR